MSPTSTSRSRAPLALGTALALTAASLTIGVTASSAVPVVYATVSGHQTFSSDANKVDSWCEKGGTKIAPGGNSYVLPTGTYSQVIVKAGSGKYANTIFAQPGNLPEAGQTVWADTNNNFAFDPGGKGGDKNISHIILCDGIGVTPETTDLTVEKNWAYLGEQPEGFELDNEDAGSLMVSVENDSRERTWTWGQLNDGFIAGASAQVSEGEVPDPADPKGYRCVITGVPTYSVNGGEPVTESPAFPLKEITNNVVVTNSVTCTRIITETPKTTLTVSKVWAYVTVPDSYTLTADNAGPLTVTVGGTATDQAWSSTKSGLPVGAKATISEGAVPTPPQPSNHTCKITGVPEYSVNEGPFTSSTPLFELLGADNTAKVRNTVTCTKDIPRAPATTALTVTKVWAYVGVSAPATTPTPGTLTVTVGGTATGQAWGAMASGLTVGATATVTEAAVTLPPLAGYTCTVDVPSYVVNGGTATTTAPSFALVVAPNTVTVTNTVRCAAVDAVDVVEDEGDVAAEEDVVEKDSAVAGSEDELADTGANLTGGLGAILVLAGAALIAARRFATK